MSELRTRCLLFGAVFVGYVLGGRLAFALLSVTGLGAVYFAPAGVSLAALLLQPLRRWWIVLLATGSAEAFLDVWLGDYSAAVLATFVAANTMEPLVGAALIRTYRDGAPNLARTRDLFLFLAGAGAIGPAVGAAIGASSIVNNDPSQMFGPVFFQWWLGDGLGAILVGSVIVAGFAATDDRRALRSAEGIVLLTATTTAAFIIYWTTSLDIGLILLIAAITAGVRFGSRAVSIVSLIVATIAFVSLPGTGQLIVGLDNDEALIIIKLQFAAFAVAGLVVAAEAAERDLVTEQIALERLVVADLQRALLPPERLSGEHFSAVGSYRSADTRLDIGGDWYDVTETADGMVAISIGDIVGHGAEAVASMGQLRFIMAALMAAGMSPSEALTELDHRARELRGAFAASVWVGRFDPVRSVLTYSAAGLPPPLLRLDRDAWQWLDQARGTPLGVMGVRARTEASVACEAGTLVIYTDGAVERRGESIDKGLDRLRSQLETHDDPTPEVVLDSVTTADSFDDTVMVMIELIADVRK